MVEFMDESREIIFIVGGIVLLINDISYYGKDLFLLVFQVSFGAIVATSVTETDTNRERLLWCTAIEREIPINIKVLHHTVLIRLQTFLIEILVRLKKGMKVSSAAELIKQRKELFLVHRLPTFLQSSSILFYQNPATVLLLQMHGHRHDGIVGNAIITT